MWKLKSTTGHWTVTSVLWREASVNKLPLRCGFSLMRWDNSANKLELNGGYCLRCETWVNKLTLSGCLCLIRCETPINKLTLSGCLCLIRCETPINKLTLSGCLCLIRCETPINRLSLSWSSLWGVNTKSITFCLRYEYSVNRLLWRCEHPLNRLALNGGFPLRCEHSVTVNKLLSEVWKHPSF